MKKKNLENYDFILFIFSLKYNISRISFSNITDEIQNSLVHTHTHTQKCIPYSKDKKAEKFPIYIFELFRKLLK